MNFTAEALRGGHRSTYNRPVRCMNCLYDLRNLPEEVHHCPECGNRFDPGDPYSYRDGRDRTRGPRLTGILVAAVVTLIISVLSFVCVWVAILMMFSRHNGFGI